MVSSRGVLYRILYDAVLSRLPEPTAIALGQTALRLLPFDRLPAFRLDDSRLAVTLGGARLPNPVILAAMYYDSRILERAMGLGFGAVTTKTITRDARPRPRGGHGARDRQGVARFRRRQRARDHPRGDRGRRPRRELRQHAARGRAAAQSALGRTVGPRDLLGDARQRAAHAQAIRPRPRSRRHRRRRYARQGARAVRCGRDGGLVLHRIHHAGADAGAPDPRRARRPPRTPARIVHTLSTCPHLSPRDEIARWAALSRGASEKTTICSSTGVGHVKFYAFHVLVRKH